MKRFFSLLLSLVLAGTLLCFPASAEQQNNDATDSPQIEPQITSEAAIVMDADTGAVLYQKNMTEKLSPADTAQILTVLLGIESGMGEETVTVTKETVDSVDREGTHISLAANETVKMKDLFYATMLASASDAAKTIAAAVSGTEGDFAEAMNLRMKELGGVNSSFANADGAYAENNYTTAQDLALLTKSALENETFRSVFGQVSYTMEGTNENATSRSFTTLCLLMKNSDMNVKYENAVGGKTGWNSKSGYNLVSAAKQDGRTLICVILDAETSKQRYEETVALFEYAFSAFRNVPVPTTLLAPTEIPVMRNGIIVRRITVSIPEGTFLSTSVDFQEGTMTVSSLPNHVTEGETNLRLTVSAKDGQNNTVVLGTVILEIETEDVKLEATPGGEKLVPLSFWAKLWKVIGTILLILLCIAGGIILIAALLFLVSYLQRKKRRALRRRRIEEQQREEEAEQAKASLYSGRRHRKNKD
ncbi:MAG: D-alanyl-D-alanine carboxypeptidase [Clostridia bacterium]|nr:D-alanyl-D-alanine carboxypeptidase [Clostridia bacterium]